MQSAAAPRFFIFFFCCYYVDTKTPPCRPNNRVHTGERLITRVGFCVRMSARARNGDCRFIVFSIWRARAFQAKRRARTSTHLRSRARANAHANALGFQSDTSNFATVAEFPSLASPPKAATSSRAAPRNYGWRAQTSNCCNSGGGGDNNGGDGRNAGRNLLCDRQIQL